MAFSVTHLDGSMELPEDVSGLSALLRELGSASAEHGDVAIGHESGWSLTVQASGRVVWENVEEDDAPKHLDGLSSDAILGLMALVALGEIDAVSARPWVPGYGT
jgi:hypothetical protein